MRTSQFIRAGGVHVSEKRFFQGGEEDKIHVQPECESRTTQPVSFAVGKVTAGSQHF